MSIRRDRLEAPPGLGCAFFSVVALLGAVAWFTIKMYWYKMASFFGKKPPESLLEDDTENDTNAS